MIHEVDHTHQLWRVLLMFFGPLLACAVIVFYDAGVETSLLVALAVVLGICGVIAAGLIAYFHYRDEQAGLTGSTPLTDRLRRTRPTT